MADEVREYIRAAQEAEVRGDVPGAIEHLRKAATLYRSHGNTARALQMLRHARRLDGSRQDVQDEISRLEWLPDQSLETAVSAEISVEPSDELKSELEKMLRPLDEAAVPGGDKQLFERGPAKADPQLNAWCSFCCKPRKEVGDLVAGPAGAFICSGCLFESARILAVPLVEPRKAEEPKNTVKPSLEPEEISGGAMAAVARATALKREEISGGAVTRAPALEPEEISGAAVPRATELEPEEISGAVVPRATALEPEELSGAAMAAVVRATERATPKKLRHATPQVPFFGQAAALKQVEQALSRGARLIAIVGPEGSGKSACLLDLERRGLGTRGSVEDDAKVLLIDGFDQLSDAERTLFALRFLDDPKLRAVLALRAEAPLEPVTLLSDDGPFVLHPTSGLVEAIGHKLPISLADRVDLVAVFEPLSEAELKDLALKLAEKRASELDLAEPLIDLLVQLAAKSGRGGRELETLIRRIPPGSWGLAPTAAPAKPKRGRGKKGTSP